MEQYDHLPVAIRTGMPLHTSCAPLARTPLPVDSRFGDGGCIVRGAKDAPNCVSADCSISLDLPVNVPLQSSPRSATSLRLVGVLQ
ncbi:unnamed protein product [Pylaiella littoralis]